VEIKRGRESLIFNEYMQVGPFCDLTPTDMTKVDDTYVLGAGETKTLTFTIENPRGDGVPVAGVWSLNYDPSKIKVSGDDNLPGQAHLVKGLTSPQTISLTITGVSGGLSDFTASWNVWSNPDASPAYQFGIGAGKTLNFQIYKPTANDDFIDVNFDDPEAPVQLFVLNNDYDSIGGQLRITDVSMPDHGGEVWIDPSGLFLWYKLPPPGVATSVQIHSDTSVVDDSPVVTGTAGTTTDPGGFEPFKDTFSYTVMDDYGAVANAFCQVRNVAPADWQIHLMPNNTSASQIGIDGKLGYKLQVQQMYAKKAQGGYFRPGNELWQKNIQTLQYLIVDKNSGQAVYQSPPSIPWVDSTPIETRSILPLKTTDLLQLNPKADSGEIPFLIETVNKTTGFNESGKTIQRPAGKRPWKADAATLNLLNDHMQGPSLSTNTLYIFVDKARIIDLLNKQKLSTEDLNTIKQLLQTQGLNWDDMPDRYESYSISNLKSWKYPP
jgi:hypothetical protein